MNKFNKVHFIAIGGSVMHNLAIELHKKGVKVTGSDDKIFDPAKSALKKHNLLPETGWDASKITEDLDCIILGMHARDDNPELLQAQKLGLNIFSFPEYIYQESLDKQRVVIAGSHGKTTITAIILHVLQHWKREFDYVAGARLAGFETSVKLSDAPVIIIEGDEYPSSTLDRSPKFLKYNHHIGLISGIAWDHINMFPTLEEYVDAFEEFADRTPKAGSLIFCEEDSMASIIGNKERPDVNRIEYKTHPSKIENQTTILMNGNNEIPIKVFGKHNLQNISGAKAILNRLGIKDHQFYEAIRTFRGAENRMQLIAENSYTRVFKDYAHSPSKVVATTEAIKSQFINSKLIACLELHTFSSLNKDFLGQYKNMLNAPDIAVVYYNPANFTAKNLEPFSVEDIQDAFDRTDLVVLDDSKKLEDFLLGQIWKGRILLLMSSGDFNGMNIKKLSSKIIDQN
jgi:UDP-N-acetylmuramate: L-alanyl-gamma-D-glutamyl-meso-diaminopimelate ligase